MDQAHLMQQMTAEYTEWVTSTELWRVETDVVSYVEACGVADALSCVQSIDLPAASELHIRRAVASDVAEMLALDGWTLGDWIGA